MPCLAIVVPHECLSHADDHNRFLILCHRVCLEVHVPEEPQHVSMVLNPINLCVHEWQTDAVHTRMDAGYISLSDAVRSGWRFRFQAPAPRRPPFLQVTSALCPMLLDIPPTTKPVAYVHDAFWYPRHCHSGGALAVPNLVAGVYKLRTVPRAYT